MKVAFPLLKVYKVSKNSSVNIIFKDKKLVGDGNAYSLRSWWVSGGYDLDGICLWSDWLVALFPGYVGGARKWPEKEATAVKVAELVALFPQHVGGAMKWDGEEATSMNWLSRLWYVLGRPPCKSTCIVWKWCMDGGLPIRWPLLLLTISILFAYFLAWHPYIFLHF